MGPKTGLFSSLSLRRMFAMPAALVERRVANLPVMVERRQGPRCENCDVGTLQPIPADLAGAGRLQCTSPGCAHKSALNNARESVIRAS